MTNEDKKATAKICGGIGILIVALTGIVVLWMWAMPYYTVFRSTMNGEAQLKEAESTRRVKVLEAHATQDAAKMLAQAEVERAKGVAEANRIIGTSLKDNHEYLVWLWIDRLEHSQSQTIYIPTEGGLPVLEAGRLFRQPKQGSPPEVVKPGR
jgi:hypothetical protein